MCTMEHLFGIIECCLSGPASAPGRSEEDPGKQGHVQPHRHLRASQEEVSQTHHHDHPCPQDQR